MQEQTAQSVREARLKGGSYRFDYSGWPLVLLTAEGDISHSDLDQHLVEYRSVLERNLPFALVFDASKVGKIDAYIRQRYAEFMKANNDDFGRLCRGLGFVITSPFVRGALTAVLWMVEFPFPYKIFATRDEATGWCRRQLQR